MDIIQYAGGSPANFLDVGGGANAEQIKNAFRILLSDPNVKAVLINIFGGILRCDTLATGVVAAARDLGIKVPIVVRMEGTNVELGQQDSAGFGIQLHGRRRHAGRRRESGGAGGRCAMSVLVNEETRLLVQGFTGKEGTFHAEQAIAYGTNVVGGVTPGKGGQTHLDRPVFNTVRRGREGNRRECDRDFRAASVRGRRASWKRPTPAFRWSSASPKAFRRSTWSRLGRSCKATKSRLIGPNCPGVISPGKCKIGIMPGHIHLEGNVGVVSRSGTLTYEAVGQLTKLGIGQSTCIGIGGDPIIGTTFIDAIQLFNEDPDTHAIVMIGEIGGNAEETAAAYIGKHVKKPVVGFIAGQTAPPGRRMGHAGAIISGGSGTAIGQDQGHGSGGHYGLFLARGDWRKHSEDESRNRHAERHFQSSSPTP